MCLQTLRRLQKDSYLDGRNWSASDRDLALADMVCRTIYPASELKTVRYMQENSSIGELLGIDVGKVTKDKLYGVSYQLTEKQCSNQLADCVG